MIKRAGSVAGEPVYEATLQVENQRVAILNYGCIVRRWQYLQLNQGQLRHERDLILGFNNVDEYTEAARYFGTVVGRVANRTSRGRFTINNRTCQLSINDGVHHLHGGRRGLAQRVWSMELDSALQCVRLSYDSPEGEEGYPGNVAFEVIYQLTPKGLHCEMNGKPDSPTPINLAQHNYYNLDGRGNILDHTLTLCSDSYLPVDSGLIPLGSLDPVAGTRFDFRQAKSIGEADPEGLGTDHNLVLRAGRDRALPAATLHSGDGQMTLDILTDQPGMQVYTAATLTTPGKGFDGQEFGPFAGVCLEAQGFPDAVNNPDFPSVMSTPDNPYKQSLSLQISETATRV
ncbi:MAG: galactose mutarotase [Granulosicoccus sp.]|nr:galactose mutarotase [Granulosicoccus sp.]